MIQRIQSLYLFVAVVLMGFMLFLFVPIVLFNASGDGHQMMTLMAFGFTTTEVNDGIETVIMMKSTIAIAIFAALSAALCLANIFLFKRRQLQYRLCLVAMILILVVLGLCSYYAFSVSTGIPGFGNAIRSLKPAFFFPLISLIMVWLAMNGIMKDIKLVKSLDRIR